MAKRCPSSNLLGLAKLDKWLWIISQRHYANIVASPDDHVYGLVFELTPEDEAELDVYEGVPTAYVKRYMEVEMVQKVGKPEPQNTEMVEALIYIDFERTGESWPYPEYIGRMNKGIDDSMKLGLPASYVEKYIRKFIPAQGPPSNDPIQVSEA